MTHDSEVARICTGLQLAALDADTGRAAQLLDGLDAETLREVIGELGKIWLEVIFYGCYGQGLREAIEADALDQAKR